MITNDYIFLPFLPTIFGCINGNKNDKYIPCFIMIIYYFNKNEYSKKS